MEITGKLLKKLELQKGVTKTGKEWQRQSCIVETADLYNKEICVNAFGEDKIKDLNKIKDGDNIYILFNIYSREFNGKYYTSVDGYWFSRKKNEDKKENATEVSNEDMPF